MFVVPTWIPIWCAPISLQLPFAAQHTVEKMENIVSAQESYTSFNQEFINGWRYFCPISSHICMLLRLADRIQSAEVSKTPFQLLFFHMHHVCTHPHILLGVFLYASSLNNHFFACYWQRVYNITITCWSPWNVDDLKTFANSTSTEKCHRSRMQSKGRSLLCAWSYCDKRSLFGDFHSNFCENP